VDNILVDFLFSRGLRGILFEGWGSVSLFLILWKSQPKLLAQLVEQPHAPPQFQAQADWRSPRFETRKKEIQKNQRTQTFDQTRFKS
jgi:hypothetical protein